MKKKTSTITKAQWKELNKKYKNQLPLIVALVIASLLFVAGNFAWDFLTFRVAPEQYETVLTQAHETVSAVVFENFESTVNDTFTNVFEEIEDNSASITTIQISAENNTALIDTHTANIAILNDTILRTATQAELDLTNAQIAYKNEQIDGFLLAHSLALAELDAQAILDAQTALDAQAELDALTTLTTQERIDAQAELDAQTALATQARLDMQLAIDAIIQTQAELTAQISALQVILDAQPTRAELDIMQSALDALGVQLTTAQAERETIQAQIDILQTQITVNAEALNGEISSIETQLIAITSAIEIIETAGGGLSVADIDFYYYITDFNSTDGGLGYSPYHFIGANATVADLNVALGHLGRSINGIRQAVNYNDSRLDILEGA